MVELYNRGKAVDYAQKYALTPNPKFYFFGGIGGDCTNFVSQCLLAGGCTMNFTQYYGWYYKSESSRSPSWTAVAYLLRFLLDNNEVGPFAKIVKPEEIELGDVILLQQNPSHFNHSVIVSKIVNGKILVCAHTDNAKDRPLDDYFFNKALYLHIEGNRI